MDHNITIIFNVKMKSATLLNTDLPKINNYIITMICLFKFKDVNLNNIIDHTKINRL